MTSPTLLKAREYEKTAQEKIPAGERPAFHLSTRAGWLNDPNGFSFYKGEYHLFYQYYPYAPHWDSMHWGHAVTRDLLHWAYLPAVLAPDAPYDDEGCFSGNALQLPDGRHLLMYTGVKGLTKDKEQRFNEKKKVIQTQCLAVGDGIDYEKYEGNPVLTPADLPEGASTEDFRDPKLWLGEDGIYRCIAASRAADGTGQILLFTSNDAFHWSYHSVVIANRGRFGTMWECPDLFELDGKWVLLTSPMDMLPKDFEYHNGNGSLCLIGDFDMSSGVFSEESDQAIDYGIDFYAAQTILTPDGRRVMIGWMQNWDTCDLHMQKNSWAGQMTLPRELSIRNGRLYQQPVRELKQLRTEEAAYENVLVEGRKTLEGISGRQVELDLEVRPLKEGYRKFLVRFAENEMFHTQVSFRPAEKTLKIDRKFSGSRRAIIHQRRAKVHTPDDVLRLHIILDRFSAEIFVNDGEQVMTATFYTDRAAEGISFFAEGAALLSIRKWTLKT